MLRGDALQVLGLDPSVSDESEIRKAYKTKALRLHPDKGGDKEQFLKLKEAYDLLSSSTDGDRGDEHASNDGENMGETDMNDFLRAFWERYTRMHMPQMDESDEEEGDEGGEDVDLDESEEEVPVDKENHQPQSRAGPTNPTSATIPGPREGRNESGDGVYETGFNINNGFRYQKINVDKQRAEKAAMYEGLKARTAIPSRNQRPSTTPPTSSTATQAPATRTYIPEKEPPKGTKAHRRWVIQEESKRKKARA